MNTPIRDNEALGTVLRLLSNLPDKLNANIKYIRIVKIICIYYFHYEIILHKIEDLT